MTDELLLILGLFMLIFFILNSVNVALSTLQKTQSQTQLPPIQLDLYREQRAVSRNSSKNTTRHSLKPPERVFGVETQSRDGWTPTKAKRREVNSTSPRVGRDEYPINPRLHFPMAAGALNTMNNPEKSRSPRNRIDSGASMRTAITGNRPHLRL
ncbi:hypothetical protein F4824DRAFT_517115 [Ustulina deusta]|nr:hypothetical protein F4824DRAFT_517115 [Ustulina deusta]